MPHATANGISLYYEAHGEPSAPTMVLIAGQGAQLISWPPRLRELLVNRGFRVLQFDNRDVGLSTKCDRKAPYALSDMADDLAGLLDTLRIDAAHIVGQSMGGMIAQELTIRHPERVLSLCSIYAAPSPAFITTHPDVWDVREREPAREREEAIRDYIERERACGLAEYSEEWIRANAEETIDRCYYPEGAQRQMDAVRRSTDRTEALRAVTVPTAVIHGLEDLLIDFSGGIATAAAVPGAELHLYADMGHQLVPSLWEDYARVISRTAARVSRSDRRPASGDHQNVGNLACL